MARSRRGRERRAQLPEHVPVTGDSTDPVIRLDPIRQHWSVALLEKPGRVYRPPSATRSPGASTPPARSRRADSPRLDCGGERVAWRTALAGRQPFRTGAQSSSALAGPPRGGTEVPPYECSWGVASSGGTSIGMSSRIWANDLPSGSERSEAIPPPPSADLSTKLSAPSSGSS